MTRVFIQQPYFAPWLGFFAKLAACDVFIALDDAAHRRNHLSRTGVREADGRLRWFKVPVGASQGVPINRVPLPTETRYLDKHLRALEVSYGRAAVLPRIADMLRDHLVDQRHPSLADANIALIRDLAEFAGLGMPTVLRASALDRSPHRSVRSQALLRIAGATSVIVGDGGALAVHDFAAMGIRVQRISYRERHPVYRQVHERRGGQFMPGLSILDCLLNVEGDACGELIGAVPADDLSPGSLPVRAAVSASCE